MYTAKYIKSVKQWFVYAPNGIVVAWFFGESDAKTLLIHLNN